MRCSGSGSRFRWSRVVRALGELFQERVCFSHDIERRPSPEQLRLEFRILRSEPNYLGGIRGRFRAGVHGDPPVLHIRVQHTAIAGDRPLLDMRGIQTLPTQDRTLLTQLGGFVFREDR